MTADEETKMRRRLSIEDSENRARLSRMRGETNVREELANAKIREWEKGIGAPAGYAKMTFEERSAAAHGATRAAATEAETRAGMIKSEYDSAWGSAISMIKSGKMASGAGAFSTEGYRMQGEYLNREDNKRNDIIAKQLAEHMKHTLLLNEILNAIRGGGGLGVSGI